MCRWLRDHPTCPQRDTLRGGRSKPANRLLAWGAALLLGLVWYWVPHPIVPIALAMLPIALVVVLGYPFIMVVFFVVFSFFRIHEVFPVLYALKIPLLLSLASIVALGWHLMISQKLKVYWRFELGVIALFFFWVSVGVIFASNRGIAIAYFKGIYWKIALMMFAIAWLTRRVKDFAFASRLFTVAGAGVALVALSNKITGVGLVEGGRVTIGRAIGSVLGDPNDLALVLMFPAAFSLSLLLNKGIGRYSRILGGICFILLFSAVIATQSRGGLLGILAVIGLFAYRRIQSKSVLFVGGAIVAVVLYAAAGIGGRASGGAAESGIDESAMGRLYAWEAAFHMAVDNPFTGVGLDNFYYNYYFYSKHWDGLNHAVHSTWFGVLAETGFVGLLLFIGMITVLIRSAYRSLVTIEATPSLVSPEIVATAQAVLSGLVATVVSGTFLTQGFTWPIYILSALVCAIAQWVAHNTEKPIPH